MIIDLSRFVQSKSVIAPVVDGWGKFEGRKFEFETANGWYRVMLGNNCSIERPATPLEVYKTLKDKKHYQVYAYGEEGIPVNFDTFKQKGLGETVRVRFLNAPIYTVSKIVEWEDGRFYFFENSRSNGDVGRALRDIQNGGRWTDIKGVTPELGYYALLLSLSVQAFREVDRLDKLNLSPEEKEKRVKQFANTIEERLKKLIEDSGGKFIEYKVSRGKAISVTWELGGQVVKSQISPDTFGIISAGFCLSGDDKRHTMSSIVKLAKDFQEDRPLYITRE